MKFLIGAVLCLSLSSSLFSCMRCIHRMDDSIDEIDIVLSNFRYDHDSCFDLYTYYYMMGKKDGFIDAQFMMQRKHKKLR